MFGPLSFQNDQKVDVGVETPCLLCDDTFNINICLPIFLKHIFETHNVIIEDPQHIESLEEYVSYWKTKFKTTCIEEVVPAVAIESTTYKYFVLSNLLKEDKLLRHRIKLDYMLKTQELERNDVTFKKGCLFCKLQYEGKRCGYLDHLLSDHNIRIGNPQNLVFVDDLIKHIETKLESLQCLYCEKTFVDRTTLKEHMRKKLHKRINPSNKLYDKYFSINYLNPDKDWHAIEKETDPPHCDSENDLNNDDEYQDWNEPETLTFCLFCPIKENNVNRLCLHMTGKHSFNFYALAQHLDFYQKVKLVNYIRKRVHNICCFSCGEKFEDARSLEEHVNTAGHGLPDVQLFDQPEFYFPTYENDTFLYFLEDIED